MNTESYKLETPWTWKDRLRAKLFPFKPCELPEAPPTFKDCIHSTVRCELSFADRVRVLLIGKVEIESRIVTEFEVGSVRTSSVFRGGRFWK